MSSVYSQLIINPHTYLNTLILCSFCGYFFLFEAHCLWDICRQFLSQHPHTHVYITLCNLWLISRTGGCTLCNMSTCHLYATVPVWDPSAFLSCVWFSLWLKSPPLCCLFPLSQCLYICTVICLCLWVCFGVCVCVSVYLHVLYALSACSQLIKTQCQLSCFLPVCLPCVCSSRHQPPLLLLLF